MPQIKKGYIPSIIAPDHYILGASVLPQVVIRPSGNWNDYSAKKESQIMQFETDNCTGFNSIAAIETLEFFLTGVRPNYSDRWLGIVAGTTPSGNDPHTVCEAIRKNGLIPDSMLPFSNDLQNVDEYYSFKGADEAACRKAGQDWLAKWSFGHEWVLSGPKEGWKERMELALTYSPLAGAVYAWQQKGGGMANASELFIRPPEGAQDGHWTGIINAIPNIDWDIQDSYDPFQKKLDWDFGFTHVKRFSMSLKPNSIDTQTKAGLMVWLVILLKKLLWIRTSQI